MTKIRDLKNFDFDEWLKLFKIYAAHYKTNLSKEGIQTTWNWLMADTHPLTGIVAENNSKLAGLLHFRAMPSPLRGKNIGFCDDIVVSPENRGFGIAQMLFNDVKLRGKNEKWGVIRWITRDNNYKARHLYDKLSEKTDWNLYEMSCDF